MDCVVDWLGTFFHGKGHQNAKCKMLYLIFWADSTNFCTKSTAV